MGDVFFPPEVLLHAGTKAAEGIVGVHDDVNDRVDESSQNG